MTPAEFKSKLSPLVQANLTEANAANILGMVSALHEAVLVTIIASRGGTLGRDLLASVEAYTKDLEMIRRREEAQRDLRDANKALKDRYPDLTT